MKTLKAVVWYALYAIVTCWAVAATYIAIELDGRVAELYDEQAISRELLRMAAQAIPHERRLNVVDSVDYEGPSAPWAAAKWEFCYEFPRYADFEEGKTPSVYVAQSE